MMYRSIRFICVTNSQRSISGQKNRQGFTNYCRPGDQMTMFLSLLHVITTQTAETANPETINLVLQYDSNINNDFDPYSRSDWSNFWCAIRIH